MQTLFREVNFDGLVGQTHNFSGLSEGNLASRDNAAQVSNPRAAALQGLEKMKRLADMGYMQGVLPPHERPYINALKNLGFSGSDREVWEQAWRKSPELARACSAASAMWVANAATVSPSADTADRKVHFTPANLSSMFHRYLEQDTTANILSAIFADSDYFVHHPPLPGASQYSDEGAANHTRLCHDYGNHGIEFFVYGKRAFEANGTGPKKFPARQTYEASQAIARRHQLAESRVVFAQQNPEAIDAGVFHNDVIAVGNKDLLFYHEQAFVDTEQVRAALDRAMGEHGLNYIEVPTNLVSLADAVTSYLFNTQLLAARDGRGHIMIAPTECETTPSVKRYLDELIADKGIIREVHYMNLRQSMKNGGGPACLRLRVALSTDEIDAINAKVFLTPTLYEQLTTWVNQHYRDRLAPDELRDPNLIDECRTALDELTQILGLGAVYPFQQGG